LNRGPFFVVIVIIIEVVVNDDDKRWHRREPIAYWRFVSLFPFVGDGSSVMVVVGRAMMR